MKDNFNQKQNLLNRMLKSYVEKQISFVSEQRKQCEGDNDKKIMENEKMIAYYNGKLSVLQEWNTSLK
jgi:hypothetical protein